ncbi:hypothetical protein BGW80DRAFT_1252591 [Lactifluus volemus]|nr:hypothetical protein BGW80DRAFT_1252591 [Lactifluus volemus]
MLTQGYATEQSQHETGTDPVMLQSIERLEGVYPSSPDQGAGSPAGIKPPPINLEEAYHHLFTSGPLVDERPLAIAEDDYVKPRWSNNEDKWPKDPATENPKNDNYEPNYTNPGAPHYENNLDYGLRTRRIQLPGQAP